MTDTIGQILRHEERLVHAKRELDLDALDRLYADDLLLTGVMGEPTCSKAAIMEEVRRGITQRQTGQQFEVSAENEDMKVVTHAGTAITNYRFVVTVKGPSVDVRTRYRTTNVWVEREGRWQIVASHTAFVLDPKQAAMLSAEGR